MVWLRGQTTAGGLVDKLVKLITGEVADDFAQTTPVGDRWIRDIGGQNFLCSPASVKVPSGAAGLRAGYWEPMFEFFNPGVYEAQGDNARYVQCRQTAVATVGGGSILQASGNTSALVLRVLCNVANTVAGDYSTAKVFLQYGYYDRTTRVLQGYFTLLGNVNLGADGTLSLSSGGLGTIKVTNPVTGILPTNVYFERGFTAAYPGGVDQWPHYARRQATATHSFGTAPTGSSGTDWDVIDALAIGTYQGFGTPFTGLGIKTLTGLSGNLYTVSCDIAYMRINMMDYNITRYGVTAETGTISPGLDPIDGVNYRSRFTRKDPLWLTPFDGSVAVASSSLVQYWMCVKPDKILIIANGDPGAGGRLGTAGIFTFTPYYPTYDLWPWFLGRQPSDNTLSNFSSTSFGYPTELSLDHCRRAVTNNDIGTRDWSTGWSRAELWPSVGGYGEVPLSTGTYNNQGAFPQHIGIDQSGGNSGINNFAPGYETKPNGWDGRWHLYGWEIIDQFASVYSAGAPFNGGANLVRGKVENHALYVPSLGWTTGDELVDSITGRTYFLVQAEYTGIGGMVAGGSAKSGGMAIWEEA